MSRTSVQPGSWGLKTTDSDSTSSHLMFSISYSTVPWLCYREFKKNSRRWGVYPHFSCIYIQSTSARWQQPRIKTVDSSICEKRKKKGNKERQGKVGGRNCGILNKSSWTKEKRFAESQSSKEKRKKKKDQLNQEAQKKKKKSNKRVSRNISLNMHQKGTGPVFPFLYPPSSPRDGDGDGAE